MATNEEVYEYLQSLPSDQTDNEGVLPLIQEKFKVTRDDAINFVQYYVLKRSEIAK